MLSEYRDQFAGLCFILGNGPSLNLLTKDERDALEGNFTFAGGRFFQWENHWPPSFYLYTEPEHINGTRPVPYFMAQATVAKMACRWQPLPDDWVEVPITNNLAHNALNYGFKGLMGCEEGASHVHPAKETPLVAVQVALYLGFTELYLLGVDGGGKGSRNASGGVRKGGKAFEQMAPFYERAASETGLKDCTPNGAYNVAGIVPYVALFDALA